MGPSASPTPALADLTSRSPVSTPASTMVATMARGLLSPSTEEWLSTLDTLCLPLTGLLRDSALDTATGMGTATTRGPLSLSMGQQLLLRTTTTSTDTSLAPVIPSASL